MKLIEIDKKTYRKRLNVAIVLGYGSLAVAALAFSSVLISLFGNPDGGNFKWNVLGVLLAVPVPLLTISALRKNPYLHEIIYVWNLKQELNLIQRYINKIKADVEAGDTNAMTILSFSYHGSKQLWELDDNTIVMDDLNDWMQKLDSAIAASGQEVSADDYHRDLLDPYRGTKSM